MKLNSKWNELSFDSRLVSAFVFLLCNENLLGFGNYEREETIWENRVHAVSDYKKRQFQCGKNLSQISLCVGSKDDSFPNVVFSCKIRLFFRITSETQKVTVWYRKKVIYREESVWNSEQCTARNGGPYGGAQEI